MMIVSAEADKAIYFGAAAFAGMVYSYTVRWAESDLPKDFWSWWSYMTGDFKAVFIALRALAFLCVGAGGFEYLNTLSTWHILGAGAYIGTLVPQTVDKGAVNGKSK